MKTGPKYKIARRLGAPIYEKTQSPKYTLSLARKEKSGKMPSRPRSEFGLSLQEKQKARFSYGLSEKQFRSYVDKALNAANAPQKLFSLLEQRLDNVLYRSGFAKTRASARQMASHGHILVNGRRVTIPSIVLKSGDTVTVRPGSAQSPLFAEVAERMKSQATAPWLKVNPEMVSAEVVGEPVYNTGEQIFNLNTVIEFYNR